MGTDYHVICPSQHEFFELRTGPWSDLDLTTRRSHYEFADHVASLFAQSRWHRRQRQMCSAALYLWVWCETRRWTVEAINEVDHQDHPFYAEHYVYDGSSPWKQTGTIYPDALRALVWRAEAEANTPPGGTPED